MIFTIVLCGGSGSRLWPLSKLDLPKQFLRLIDNDTLIQNSVDKIKNISDNIIFVTNDKYESILSILFNNKYTMVLEPVQRNTAPAILASCLHIKSITNNKNVKILVIPSDHYYDKEYFQNIITNCLDTLDNNIITLGITPTYPETGYGYIKYDGDNIMEFVEKPNIGLAQQYLDCGNYLWNAGIFIFNLNTIIKEFKSHAFDLYKECKQVYKKSSYINNTLKLDTEFDKCQNISFDYAIMEKTRVGKVIKYDGVWTDIGDWDRLNNLKESDQYNNIIDGQHITFNTTNTFIKSNKGIITTVGIDNMVIVKNNDDILVAKKGQCDNIRHINKEIKLYEDTKKNYRPWGYYETLQMSRNQYQVKRIIVYPNKRLSLQYHNKRSEHWVIINGNALVQIGDDLQNLSKNQSVYIPIGVKHRITNIGINNVEFIETQIGSYLGEDDIVRLDDDFGRL